MVAVAVAGQMAGCTVAWPFGRSGGAGEAQPPAAAALAVLPPAGVPLEWRLDERVATALRQRNIPAKVGAGGDTGYELSGQAEHSAAEHGRDAALTLRWRIADRQGNTIAEVVQLAAVPADRDTAGSRFLDGVASAAAESIVPVVPTAQSRTAPVAPAVEAQARPPGRDIPTVRPVPASASGAGALKPTLSETSRAHNGGLHRPGRPAIFPGATPKIDLAEAKSAPSPGFVVQVGSFRSQTTAEKTWAELQARQEKLLGGIAYHLSQHDFGRPKGVYYRLQIGPYPDRAKAERLCASLKAAGESCFVAAADFGTPPSSADRKPVPPVPAVVPSTVQKAASRDRPTPVRSTLDVPGLDE